MFRDDAQISNSKMVIGYGQEKTDSMESNHAAQQL
jgi:hypothetical protein